MIGLKDDKRRKRIALYGGIFIALFAVILIICRNNPTQELPVKILQLKLIEQVKGDKARSEINELHQKDIAPPNNVIGKYQSIDGSAALYLSAYSIEKDASEQFEKMLTRISENNGVFTHFRETDVDGVRVILCLGLGQAHYFFVCGSNLYWFAVDMPIAHATAKELIRLTKPTI